MATAVPRRRGRVVVEGEEPASRRRTPLFLRWRNRPPPRGASRSLAVVLRRVADVDALELGADRAVHVDAHRRLGDELGRVRLDIAIRREPAAVVSPLFSSWCQTRGGGDPYERRGTRHLDADDWLCRALPTRDLVILAVTRPSSLRPRPRRSGGGLSHIPFHSIPFHYLDPVEALLARRQLELLQPRRRGWPAAAAAAARLTGIVGRP